MFWWFIMTPLRFSIAEQTISNGPLNIIFFPSLLLIDLQVLISDASDIVAKLHSYGYKVHVYTIRNDQLHPAYHMVKSL